MDSNSNLDDANIEEKTTRLRPKKCLEKNITTDGSRCSPIRQVMTCLYENALRETLCQAIQDGYAGVDVSHIEIECLSTHSTLDVWQARTWHKEPSERPNNHGRRYDFRYYDREQLLKDIKHGEVLSLFVKN